VSAFRPPDWRPKKSGGDLRQTNQFDQRLQSEFISAADAYVPTFIFEFPDNDS